MTSIEDVSIPIDVDSNGEDEVAETNSRIAKNSTNISAGVRKPVANGKPRKRQRKLTYTIWEHY